MEPRKKPSRYRDGMEPRKKPSRYRDGMEPRQRFGFKLWRDVLESAPRRHRRSPRPIRKGRLPPPLGGLDTEWPCGRDLQRTEIMADPQVVAHAHADSAAPAESTYP